MQGIVLSFDNTNVGTISGNDGNRYSFTRADWQDAKAPAKGQVIDFKQNEGAAKEIIVLQSSNGSKHNKVLVAVLCFFFGYLGVHRFMTGKIGTGIVMLILFVSIFIPLLNLITIWVAAPVLFIWALVDFIMILTGKFQDSEGNYI